VLWIFFGGIANESYKKSKAFGGLFPGGAIGKWQQYNPEPEKQASDCKVWNAFG
jgi:hypothetical protein